MHCLPSPPETPVLSHAEQTCLAHHPTSSLALQPHVPDLCLLEEGEIAVWHEGICAALQMAPRNEFIIWQRQQNLSCSLYLCCLTKHSAGFG